MKVGLMLPSLGSVEINEAGLHGAEALGMDSVWLPDHMLGPCHPELWSEIPASGALADPDAFLDPFCVAAILGRQTTVTLGTCVTDATRRRGADLARAALTLQRSCGGDFVLGIGCGEAESLLPFGYPFERPIGLLEEALRDMRSLLDTGLMPDGGLGRAGLVDGISAIPQIWVAANGPRSLRLTGTYADGWLPMGGISTDEYARQRAVVMAAARSAGRPEPVCSLFPLIILGESRAAVAEIFESNPLMKTIVLFAPASTWQRYGLDHPSGPTCRGYPDTIPHALAPDVIRRALESVPLEMMEEFVMTGNADDVAAQLSPYGEVGLDHVVLCDITGFVHTPETTMSLLPQYAALRAMLAPEAIGV